jgi:hypothetical protein
MATCYLLQYFGAGLQHVFTYSGVNYGNSNYAATPQSA